MNNRIQVIRFDRRKTMPTGVRRAALAAAFFLGWFTIVYNIIEGLVSVFFGTSDGALALLGFGVDSFVEVISGVGIVHMLYRGRRTTVKERTDRFERTALRVTGTAFYILTAGLAVGAVVNLVLRKMPETTLPGLVIALVSIASMYWLMKAKQKAGRTLASAAILADAECTKTCLILSLILLASSGLYVFFKIPYFDIAGSLFIAWFAFREGREAFEKAERNSFDCGCGDQDGGRRRSPD